MTSLLDLGEQLYASRPDPTPEQMAERRATVRDLLERRAPELLELVLGGGEL